MLPKSARLLLFRNPLPAFSIHAHPDNENRCSTYGLRPNIIMSVMSANLAFQVALIPCFELKQIISMDKKTSQKFTTGMLKNDSSAYMEAFTGKRLSLGTTNDPWTKLNHFLRFWLWLGYHYEESMARSPQLLRLSSIQLILLHVWDKHEKPFDMNSLAWQARLRMIKLSIM